MANDIPGPVYLPLSGAVTQTFAPWINLTVNVGQSSSPKLEDTVIKGVASYGRQLGRIGEALTVLIEELQLEQKLPEGDRKRAITDLKRMLTDIARAKKDHGAPFVIEPS